MWIVILYLLWTPKRSDKYGFSDSKEFVLVIVVACVFLFFCILYIVYLLDVVHILFTNIEKKNPICEFM